MKFRIHTLLLLISAIATPVARAQTISFFLPEAAQRNQQVSIYDLNNGFQPGTVVRFGGIVAFSTTVGFGQIQAWVPNSAPLGPVTLSVQNPPGPQVFSPTNFIVVTAAPYVSSFTPTSGPGGTVMTINGFQFQGNVTAVQVNGTNVAGYFIESNTRIFATNTLGVTTGPITVVGNGTGSYTTSNLFYVSPVISGFSPASGQAGGQITIAGLNFVDATQVLIGGVSAPLFNVNGNTQIVATLPVGVVSGKVNVWTPGGQYLTSSNFTVLPSITGVTPSSGSAGTAVTLSGANLNVPPVSVKFNGVNAAIVSSNFNQIVVTAPASSSGPVTVTTGDGTATSAALFYYPPSITSFTPGFGGGGTLVNISGQSFTNATSVLFDGAPALFYAVSNNTLIQAAAPNSVSTGPITVSTPPGFVAQSATPFYGVATFTGFLPATGPPGTDVILFGSNFEGATSVTFNGVAASILSNTGTQIGTRVPAGARTGLITVTTPAGSFSSPSPFIVPNISDMRLNTFNHTPNPVTITSNLTFVVVPSNDGPDTASNVTVSVTLSPSVVLKSATVDPPGTVNTNGNPVIATIPSMTLFQNPTFTLVVAPQQTGNITNTATVGSSTTDPNPGNNSITRVTLVQPLPVLEIATQDPKTLRVAWPAALSNYTLQSAALLATNSTWTNVATPPFIDGEKRVVLQSNAAPSRYYRLKK